MLPQDKKSQSVTTDLPVHIMTHGRLKLQFKIDSTQY